MSVLDQMMEIRSLSFFTVFVYALFGGVLLTYSLVQRRFRGLTYIGVADFMAAVGFLLVSLRDYISPLWSIIVANVLLSVPFILNYEGIRLFLDKPRRLGAVGLTIFTVVSLLFCYFAMGHYNVNVRIVIVCVASIVLCALIAWALLSDAPHELVAPLSVTAGGFIFYGLFCFFRIYWVLTEPPLGSLLQGGIIHGLTFLVADVMVAAGGLGILWVASARLENELTRQARIDSLTGLYNRRALDELAERELSRCLRNGSPLSVIMADIDHFKPINDKYGHKTGDTVLTRAAALMARCLRKEDILARYGGEEFIAILPDAEKSQAMAVAEKLRSAFAKESFSGNGKDIRLSVSFGVSTLGEDGDTMDELTDRADDALYSAKQQGRNRVVAFAPR